VDIVTNLKLNRLSAVLRRVRKIEKSAYYFCHVRPSVRPSACISVTVTGRIVLKFDIEDLNENFARKGEVCYNRAKVLHILHGDLNRHTGAIFE
jgi:hypothetical protein